MYERVNQLLGTDFKSDIDINWSYISACETLSEDFIREFKHNVNWNNISMYQTLSESFIREFKHNVSWNNISMYQTLSESFIREFKDRVSWYYISSNQVLSEDFIREYKDIVIWDRISRSQILSWEFILEFRNKLNWYNISRHQPYIDPSYEKIDEWYLKKNKLYYLYRKTKDKGWFIGYKKRNGNDFSYEITKSLDVKCRVYWKDLKLIKRIDKFELIREVKYVRKSK